MPFGFNIESVSTRRIEIDATVELSHEVAELLDRGTDDPPRDEAESDASESALV